MSHPKGDQPRPAEQEAVRTTIVGGRPPGSGKRVGSTPRGIEVLVKKASIDAEFHSLLLEKRAAAASTIGLDLSDSEIAMINTVPEAQLRTIIQNATVRPEQKKAFLGKVAAVMLVALATLGSDGCNNNEQQIKGIRPDPPEQSIEQVKEEPDLQGADGDDPKAVTAATNESQDLETHDPYDHGIDKHTRGSRPDRP